MTTRAACSPKWSLAFEQIRKENHTLRISHFFFLNNVSFFSASFKQCHTHTHKHTRTHKQTRKRTTRKNDNSNNKSVTAT